MMNKIRALNGLLLTTSMAVLTPTSCTHDAGGDPQGSPVSPPPVACTLIGCDDGLVVELRPASGWPAGEYRFGIRADGSETTCQGMLPLASCAEPSVTCDGNGVARIVESGCGLPAGAQAFPAIVLDPTLRPRRVEITITRDGRVVGEADLEPTFQRIHPNGPACPPACDVARAAIDLRF